MANSAISAPLLIPPGSITDAMLANGSRSVTFDINWTHGLGSTIADYYLKPVAKVGGSYALASADTAANVETVGVIIAYVSASTLTIQQYGRIDTSGVMPAGHGYTGPVCFVPAAAGFPTETPPATGGQYVKPILRVIDANTVEVLDYPATVVGVALSSDFANPNVLDNPGPTIWQRGTTVTPSSSTATYLADRWFVYRGATGFTCSQATGNQTGNKYCVQVQRTKDNSATNTIWLAQVLESLNSIPLAGKQVTLSFYAKAGANYSAASGNLIADIVSGTGTDQSAATLITGLTNAATVATLTQAITTTSTRYSLTGTVGATATQIGVRFQFVPFGTAGDNDWFQVEMVKLEISASATAFVPECHERELARCQRRCFKAYSQSGRVYFLVGTGWCGSTSSITVMVPTPVTMAKEPVVTLSGNWSAADTYAVGTPTTIDLSSFGGGTQGIGMVVSVSGTPFTAGKPAFLFANNDATAYLLADAEL